MSIHKRWRFTDAMVRDAPDCPGVYNHLGLENVTHYSWEITRAPKARAAQIERELGLAIA